AAKAFDDAFETGQRALAACPLPTIARIQGHCIGGGLELALACDLRIAIERAKFGYPVARFGLIPTPASLERLIESIGPNQAKWLLFTGEWISAQQAEAWGLINRAIPDETFEADVEQIVAQTAQGAPLTISVSKHLIETKTKQGQLGEAIIDWAYQKIYTSRDLQEGLRAFQEKRRPAFQNK
ncbi:MAG: enoyl-CoA hydratase-related protein, partial [Chloroflexota bacterium]